MGTSKSTEDKWHCRMLISSGRPDPDWPLDKETAAAILEYCKQAPPYENVFEIPSILGYNGVMFYNAKESYRAFKGRLEYSSGNKTVEKTDRGRKLEIMVLKTAPEEYKALALNQLTTDFD